MWDLSCGIVSLYALSIDDSPSLVDEPLHFTSALQNMEALAKETVILTCELSKPDEEVVWLKNSELLSVGDGRHVAVNQDCSHQLVIPDVTVKDSGEYTILAGDLQSTAQLIVYGQFLLSFH